MEVIYKRPDELVEYEDNARRNDAGVAKVAESIKEFGFLQPITIDRNNVIIAGHTRLKAAKQLGLEEVPCVISDLSEEDARLARVIDNKSHEYSTWDAIESRCGKLRYFIRHNNVIHWADNRQTLYESFNLHTQEDLERVKSVTFISAKLSDNEAMTQHNPGYKGTLMAMSEFDQEQLLNGNWKIRRSAGHYFKRSKVTPLAAIPTDITKWVRAWDLAATAPGELDDIEGLPQALRQSRRGDESAYTAGVLLGKRRNGRIFVADVINVRENGADVRKLIQTTAASDNAFYGNVTIRLPQDPGQAGKDQAQSFVRMLGGYTVTTALESGDKVTRAEPFSSQWLAGNVDVKEAVWNTPLWFRHPVWLRANR